MIVVKSMTPCARRRGEFIISHRVQENSLDQGVCRNTTLDPIRLRVGSCILKAYFAECAEPNFVQHYQMLFVYEANGGRLGHNYLFCRKWNTSLTELSN